MCARRSLHQIALLNDRLEIMQAIIMQLVWHVERKLPFHAPQSALAPGSRWAAPHAENMERRISYDNPSLTWTYLMHMHMIMC